MKYYARVKSRPVKFEILEFLNDKLAIEYFIDKHGDDLVCVFHRTSNVRYSTNAACVYRHPSRS